MVSVRYLTLVWRGAEGGCGGAFVLVITCHHSSRLETADHCRVLLRIIIGYWRLCKVLMRITDGYWRLQTTRLLQSTALLLVTGHCAEYYRALLATLCRVLLRITTLWLMETVQSITADYCTLLLVTVSCAGREGREKEASARVSMSTGTRCYVSRTVAGRRSRESGTGSLSCAGREGGEKEAGCAVPTACSPRALERLHNEVRKCHADPGSDLGQSRAISLGWIARLIAAHHVWAIKCC